MRDSTGDRATRACVQLRGFWESLSERIVDRRRSANCHAWILWLREYRTPRLHFAQPSLEKTTLALVADQLERSGVAACGLLGRPESAQKIGARSMQQVMVIEIAGRRQGIQQRQSLSRSIHHRYRHGASYFRPTIRPGEHEWTKKPFTPSDPRPPTSDL